MDQPSPSAHGTTRTGDCTHRSSGALLHETVAKKQEATPLQQRGPSAGSTTDGDGLRILQTRCFGVLLDLGKHPNTTAMWFISQIVLQDHRPRCGSTKEYARFLRILAPVRSDRRQLSIPWQSVLTRRIGRKIMSSAASTRMSKRP